MLPRRPEPDAVTSAPLDETVETGRPDMRGVPEVGQVDVHGSIWVDDRTLDRSRTSWSQIRTGTGQVPGESRLFDPNVSSITTSNRKVPPRVKEQPRPEPPPPINRAGTAKIQQLVGGRYLIEGRIGQGGMGKVYKVKHARLDRYFALKIIIASVSETPENRELFYREARFASAMSHPGIVPVVDFGEDESLGMFMVMELVDGEPLHKLLFREKQLPTRMACEIALQVAEALHYIHKNDVVHCDIKTENILITTDPENKRRRWVAKLLDFGLARSLSGARNNTVLSGTPHYVAPERISGNPATPQSDVYSVGILLYELLTGRVPWDGGVQEILRGHLDEEPRPPSQWIDGGLDSSVERLVLHALSKNPADRHKDMAAFLYELRNVMDMLGVGKRKTGGTPKKVGAGRPTDQRDQLARVAFDGCRLPLALLSTDGTILTANPAFAKFVMGMAVDLEGMPIRATPLTGPWDTWEADLQGCAEGRQVRRVVEIDMGAGSVKRLLLWADGLPDRNVMVGVQPLEV